MLVEPRHASQHRRASMLTWILLGHSRLWPIWNVRSLKIPIRYSGRYIPSCWALHLVHLHQMTRYSFFSDVFAPFPQIVLMRRCSYSSDRKKGSLEKQDVLHFQKAKISKYTYSFRGLNRFVAVFIQFIWGLFHSVYWSCLIKVIFSIANSRISRDWV